MKMATIGKITVSAFAILIISALSGSVAELMDASRQLTITIGGVGGIVWCFFCELIWGRSAVSSKD